MSRSAVFLGSCLLVILGLALADLPTRLAIVSLPWLAFLPVALTTGLSLFVWQRLFRYRAISLIVLAILAFGFGLIWGLGNRVRIEPGELPYSAQVDLVGTVVSFPNIYAARQEIVLATASLGRPTKIMVSSSKYPELRRGMTIRLTGKVEEPKDTTEFAEARWLFGQGIYGRMRYPKNLEIIKSESQPWRAINLFREQMADVLVRTLPEPAASLALGLVLGTTPRIDNNFADNLRRTNLTHLAAVSGQNITLTIFVLFTFLRRYWLRGAIILALGLLAFYVVITGASASVVRAAIMAGLLLIGLLFGRPSDGLRGLILAALGIGLVDPPAVTHDIGFGLSFFALSGILLIGPKLESLLGFLPSSLCILIATTTSASLGVLPLQLISFGTVSLVGILANLLIGPLVPFAMMGSFLLVMIGTVNNLLATLLAPILYQLLSLIQVITNYLGSIPLAQILIPVPSGLLLPIMIATLIVWLILVYRKIHRSNRPWGEAVQ